MPEELEGVWYTTAETAKELGISHDAVRSAVSRGVLPARRVAPRLNMISAQDLERYRGLHLGKVGRRRQKPEGAGEAGA